MFFEELDSKNGQPDRDVAAAQVVVQLGVAAVGHTVQACGGIGLKDPRDLESNLFSVAERLECQKYKLLRSPLIELAYSKLKRFTQLSLIRSGLGS